MARQSFPDGTEVAGFYVRTIRSGPFVFVSGTTSLDSKAQVRGKDAARQQQFPTNRQGGHRSSSLSRDGHSSVWCDGAFFLARGCARS